MKAIACPPRYIALLLIFQLLSALGAPCKASGSFTSNDTLLSANGFYYRMPPTPVNHLMVGEIIAVPYLPKEVITSAKISTGRLPEGTNLYPNGFIVVENANVLVAGNYPVEIETVDAKNSKTTTPLILNITDNSEWIDTEAVYQMGESKKISELTNGDVLALPVDKDGSVKVAKCIIGTLPPGTTLTHDGKVQVTSPQLLAPQVYNMGIVTIDQRGGTTFFMVTVPLE